MKNAKLILTILLMFINVSIFAQQSDTRTNRYIINTDTIYLRNKNKVITLSDMETYLKYCSDTTMAISSKNGSKTVIISIVINETPTFEGFVKWMIKRKPKKGKAKSK